MQLCGAILQSVSSDRRNGHGRKVLSPLQCGRDIIEYVGIPYVRRGGCGGGIIAV